MAKTGDLSNLRKEYLQSGIVREDLKSNPVEQFVLMKKKYSKGEIPLPEFWGGYRIVPQSIEFWQGRANRLHDRFIYERQENEWTISRLSP